MSYNSILIHGIIHVSFYDCCLLLIGVMCLRFTQDGVWSWCVYSFSSVWHSMLPSCLVSHSFHPGKRWRQEVSQLSRTDKTVVGIFTVHPNTKGEMLLRILAFMKGSPIKISTFSVPLGFIVSQPCLQPHEASKTELEGHFPLPFDSL